MEMNTKQYGGIYYLIEKDTKLHELFTKSDDKKYYSFLEYYQFHAKVKHIEQKDNHNIIIKFFTYRYTGNYNISFIIRTDNSNLLINKFKELDVTNKIYKYIFTIENINSYFSVITDTIIQEYTSNFLSTNVLTTLNNVNQLKNENMNLNKEVEGKRIINIKSIEFEEFEGKITDIKHTSSKNISIHIITSKAHNHERHYIDINLSRNYDQSKFIDLYNNYIKIDNKIRIFKYFKYFRLGYTNIYDDYICILYDILNTKLILLNNGNTVTIDGFLNIYNESKYDIIEVLIEEDITDKRLFLLKSHRDLLNINEKYIIYCKQWRNEYFISKINNINSGEIFDE